MRNDQLHNCLFGLALSIAGLYPHTVFVLPAGTQTTFYFILKTSRVLSCRYCGALQLDVGDASRACCSAVMCSCSIGLSHRAIVD